MNSRHLLSLKNHIYSEASTKNMGITQNKSYLWKSQQLKPTGQVGQKCALWLIRIHCHPWRSHWGEADIGSLLPPYIKDKINSDGLRTMILWMVERAFRLWESGQEANLQTECLLVPNSQCERYAHMSTGKGNAQRWWLFSILIL